jgi:hypothetical protein
MTDAKPLADRAFHCAHDVFRCSKWVLADHDVAAHRGVLRGNAPDMNIVSRENTVHACDRVSNGHHIQAARRALEENVHGLEDDPECVPAD